MNEKTQRPDVELTAKELEDKYSPLGGGEHPDHSRDDWRWEVANEDTILGYWAWLENRIEMESEEQDD